MKKIILVGFSIFSLLMLLSYQYKFLPIIIERDICNNTNSEVNFKKGDKIVPLKKYDLESEDYSVYLIFNNEDSRRLGVAKALYTEEKEVLKTASQAFSGIYTDGDLATCDSYFLLMQDDKCVLKMGFLIQSEFGGLQSSEFGWIDFIDLEKAQEVLNDFSPVYFPLIKL